jgi:hypothetical protein
MSGLCVRKFWRTMAILSVVLLVSVFGFAQGELGTIAGVVTDTTGAVVADAKVQITNTATNGARNTATNSLGEYQIPQLPPAVYSVVVSKNGFQTFKATVEVAVGGHSTVDAHMAVGAGNTVVEVTAAGAATEVNTQTQELSQLVDTQQMAQLPSLTRNPYDFVAISGNVSNGDSTSNGTGQMGGQETTLHGVGYTMNGQRNTGTEILLDGMENFAVFGALIGEDVPIDAVQEYSVVTNNFGAEYGRASGGVVNVTTKTGTNSWHGSGWEFNRLSAYTANTFNNDANDLPKGTYTRNQFGFQVGGPIVKNKLFVSGSNEWIRIRSDAPQIEDVFDPAFAAMLPANAAAYFSAFATNPAPTVGTITAGQLATAGLVVNPINGVTPVAASQTVFDQVAFTAPYDAGGGLPGNSYDWVARADYNLSDKTQMFFRLGHERILQFNGTTTYSAYPQYDTGSLTTNQMYLYSLNHTFNSNLLSDTKVSFTRYNSATSFDNSLTFTPNLMFVSPVDPVDNNVIQLPGLQNLSEPGVGGVPVGGPQNTLQLEHDFSWTKGRHNMKFGGQFTYIQLNYTYGAYNQAVEQLGTAPQNSMDDLVNAVGNPLGSQLAGNGGFSARVNAEGALPCPLDQFGNPVVPCPANSVVTPPLPPAVAARSYRYKDWATYAQDSFRFTPRLTLNYGLRYEHYGVQHNNHQNLDSNFYYGPGSGLEEQVATGGVQLTQQSSVGQFWAPSWGTLAPRIGFAYDIFGDGKSSLRGGFGISYERNFGNVTYNASFNPPASAVLSETCSPDNPACTVVVTNNDLGPLGQPGPPSNLTPVELRMPDPQIHTAQTQFWSLDLQREVARNTLVEVGYSGAHGVHLYDINNINQLGAGQVYLGESANIGNPECNASNVTATGACLSRANLQYAAINDRGSRGSSSYNALNLKFQTQNLHNTGLSMVGNYTWSHSLDDESSTFSDSLQGGSGDIGSLGYTDLTNPKLDWGNSDFDVRHRVAISPIWETPWYKDRGGIGEALGGWAFSGIFTARSGVPFNVYDYDNVYVGYTVPRLTPATPIRDYHVSSNAPAIGTNNYGLLSVPVPASFAPLNSTLGISDFGPFPAGMTARNAFRGPGAWNFDTALQKKFRITERYGLEFRAEGFNIFNHHNMYVLTPNLLYDGATTTPLEVVGLKGGLNTFATGGNHDERRFGQFALRFTF